ncbi:MAG: DUF4097 family beta strand repeat-containing protein [Myxococcota bacterium]
MSIRERLGEGSSGRSFGTFLRGLLKGMPWSEKAEGEETLSFKSPQGGVLRIHNSNGSTRIVAEDRDDIEVVAQKTGRAESPEAASDLLSEIRVVAHESPERLDLEIEVPRRWNRRGSANLSIKLPRAMEVWVAAVNGRVDVVGVHGAVHARSTNGSAKICNVIGDVEVGTTNAKVCCSGTCGSLSASSSNGKIEIEGHQGSVDATTSNGLIRARLEGLSEPGVTLATSNGRILLELPETVNADVDLRVDNGVIRNDRSLCASSRESGGRVLGRLGKGGALIKLRTSNGSINIH